MNVSRIAAVVLTPQLECQKIAASIDRRKLLCKRRKAPTKNASSPLTTSPGEAGVTD